MDLQNRSLFVRQTLNELNGQFVSGPPKTKRGTRRILLPQIAVDSLLEHRKRMLAEGHAGVKRVFCDTNGGTAPSTECAASLLQTAAEGGKVSERAVS